MYSLATSRLAPLLGVWAWRSEGGAAGGGKGGVGRGRVRVVLLLYRDKKCVNTAIKRCYQSEEGGTATTLHRVHAQLGVGGVGRGGGGSGAHGRKLGGSVMTVRNALLIDNE